MTALPQARCPGTPGSQISFPRPPRVLCPYCVVGRRAKPGSKTYQQVNLDGVRSFEAGAAPSFV